MDLQPQVLVIGGGNAGLCAALAASQAGAEDVLLVERAPRTWRGGNSKYTRNLRCIHDLDPLMPGRYTAEEFRADLAAVTGDGSNPELTAIAVEGSAELSHWMERQGIRWQPAMRGTVQLSRTNRFFLGGGKALLNVYYARAEALGIEVAYDHSLESMTFDGAACTSVRIRNGERVLDLRPRCVVAAAGGFEANIEWLREYWGDAADNYMIRGARQNDGTVLRCLLDAGALPQGNPRGLHAIAVDARGPRFEGGIVTRVDSVPFGLMLNRDGERFYDEGEDLWPTRYATWGRLIAEQPGQIAYSVFDSQILGRFMTTAYPPLAADSLEALAAVLELPAEAVCRTVALYNEHVVKGTYDPRVLDDCAAPGLSPPKSHWALPVDRPPYFAYPLRPGVTFTYLGVGIDSGARVSRTSGGVFENLFAAGEIMAGNILRHGYLAGFGMTIGTVFGKLAGEQAAAHART